MRNAPEGRRLASTGVVRETASKSSRVSGMPKRPAMAMRWMTALVEPPSAISTVTAFRNDARVTMSAGRISSQTSSTMRRPQSEAMRGCAESTAGIEAAPGERQPERLDGARHRRGGAHRHAMAGRAGERGLHVVPLLLADRAGAPLVPVLPVVAAAAERLARDSARSASGRRARRSAGRPAEAAPMTRPGVVLSQPPISTTPSTGWLQISSSTSMARRLR